MNAETPYLLERWGFVVFGEIKTESHLIQKV